MKTNREKLQRRHSILCPTRHAALQQQQLAVSD
jgi:hypothetical protein